MNLANQFGCWHGLAGKRPRQRAPACAGHPNSRRLAKPHRRAAAATARRGRACFLLVLKCARLPPPGPRAPRHPFVPGKGAGVFGLEVKGNANHDYNTSVDRCFKSRTCGKWNTARLPPALRRVARREPNLRRGVGPSCVEFPWLRAIPAPSPPSSRPSLGAPGLFLRHKMRKFARLKPSRT